MTGGKQMRIVPIDCVKSNTVLGKTIYDSEGKVLLRTGAVLKRNTIDKIKELYYNEIQIYIPYLKL